MKIGYARVSTDDQNLSLQLDALDAAGCERIFEDKVSGASTERAGLTKALAAVGSGDVLTVWRLDRLGRSLPHLIATIAGLQEKGAGFHSLTEAIDTETAGGELVFHMMGALAQFERRLIAERTRSGLVAAKRRGVKLGRKHALTPTQIKSARMLVEQGQPVWLIADGFNVSRATLYRALKGS